MQIHRFLVAASACRRLCAALFLAASALPIHATDTSATVDPLSGYNARDVVPDFTITGGFTVASGKVYSWFYDWSGQDGFKIGNITTGSVQVIGVPPVVNSNGFGDAFGVFDEANGYFYAGTYNDSSGSVYRYSMASSSWSTVGNFSSLYGADIHNGKLYVSGLNAIWSGGVGQNNQLALFDLSGAGSHDVLVKATGNSAHVALDISGNLYYANYNGDAPALYRWTASQLESVRADMNHGTSGGGEFDLFLTYDDAELLTLLPGGANGIAVDLGGNVFVSTNLDSALLMWNSGLGTGLGNHYETIATVDPNLGFAWFGAMDTSGDFLNGGSVYLTAGTTGIVEISQVPEPSALVFVLGGLGILLGYRWRSHRAIL